MNIDDVKGSIDHLFECLDRIEDETEVRPGEKTIRGADGGVIDVAEILEVIDVARSDLKSIKKQLGIEP